MREAILRELIKQSENPPANDERIAAFSSCLGKLALQGESPFVETVLSSPKGPSHIVNLALRALQKQCMYRYADYPMSFNDSDRWLAAINEIEADAPHLEVLKSDMRRPVQSNVVERYKAFKLACQLMASRVGSTPRVLDVGCSRNHGLKKLSQNLPFKASDCALSSDQLGVHVLLEVFARRIMDHSIALGPSMGADLVPYGQGEDAIWARSCSFYPTELLNAAAVSEYDYLDNNNFAGVEFAVADFTNEGLSLRESGQFDVITVSTFLYQLTPAGRNRARQNFRDLLAPRGFIIYQDFARIGQKGIDLLFSKSWFEEPYPYRTMIEFAEEPLRIYEMLRWDNGRCNSWMPGADIDYIMSKQ